MNYFEHYVINENKSSYGVEPLGALRTLEMGENAEEAGNSGDGDWG